MKRKDFIKSIGLVAGAFLLPKKTIARDEETLQLNARGKGRCIAIIDEDGFVSVEESKLEAHLEARAKRRIK